MSTSLCMPDLLLVGCVKKKRSHVVLAKDLYDSTLWRWRRAYAEASGCSWYVLSAKHGLLDPNIELEPYDLALSDLSPADRRLWSQRVLRDLKASIPELRGKVIEIHAGQDYVKYGLVKGLQEVDAVVHCPLEHIGLFYQPAWYREQLALGFAKRWKRY